MRLLLAEDERDLSRALVTILEHNHYSVDAVYNGLDALDYLETELYDCAVLDIMMPGMDGLTVLRKIRESKNQVPVILLTAKSEIDDRVIGLDCGADDYLTKPFSTKELLARIRAVTRRRNDSTDNLLEFGDIKLDRSTFVVSSPKTSFRLASKEFQMLEMMMANPFSVIPTERFLEKIWGYDTEVEPNIVWVNISYLRKKLVKLDSRVQIKAMRNLGYFLEEV